jgi:predicted lipid-binding transport protein (Tim44 family)
MKITNAIILKTIALVALGTATACHSTTTAGTNSANPPANSSAAPTGPRADKETADKPAAPEVAVKDSDKTSTVSAATPTEAYKAAYAARQNKDVAALKKLMSKDALEFLEIFSEPGKSIDDTLRKMMETPQAATDESRNEKITGETATIEYPDGQGKWKKMDFIKEGGEWKLHIPKPDPKDVKIN